MERTMMGGAPPPREHAVTAPPPVRGYRRPAPGTQPEHLHPPYRSSRKRAPTTGLIPLPPTLSEVTGPVFQQELAEVKACDLTRQHSGPPLGERIVVGGRVLDEDGRAVPGTLVEVWQANAAGRYQHVLDRHDAPLDPNFTGCGRILTDDEGRYRIVTVRPGAYPWGNHENAWRPAHIHFSVFGPAFATRLVTQMYFPGDPLLASDPIFNCTADEKARGRLVSVFDWDATVAGYALGYRFDVVLSGREATPLEAGPGLVATTSQTVGPFFSIGLGWLARADLASPGVHGERVSVAGRVLDGDGQPVSDALLELWQANASGRYAHPEDTQSLPLDPAFRGYGRVPTDGEGRFHFTTVKPGPVPGPGGAPQAPHIVVSVFARGLLKRLVSRMYFPDEPANASDLALGLVEPARRGTLVAQRQRSGSLEWNVVLQGPGETVFFDC
jgi:protocatechuate 3,4-dioxygenase beta subunit